MAKTFKKFTKEEKKEWIESKEKEKEEIFKSISEGIKEFKNSDKLKEYLDVMSKFHKYSYNNLALIRKQLPNATHIASYKKWKDLDRSVNKGEKSIKILAPIISKKTKEVQKKEKDTGIPLYDKDNNPIIEEKKEVITKGFKLVPVFDISQTSGKELPKLVEDISIDKDIDKVIDAVKLSSSCPVKSKDTLTFSMKPDVRGYYDLVENEINIRPNMPNLQTLKTLIHEMAHSEIHTKDKSREETTNEQREIEAESVAYVTCKKIGLDTSEYSFPYIASWAGMNEDKVKGSLDIIQKTSSEFIEKIESNYEKLTKKKELKKNKENEMER